MCNHIHMNFDNVIGSLVEFTGLDRQLFIELSDLCLISGGAVTRALINCPADDVDVFVPSFVDQDNERVWSLIDIIFKYTGEVKLKVNYCRSIINIHTKKKVIQLILHSGNVDEIFEGMDFDYGRVGIHKGELIMKEDAKIAFEEGTCSTFTPDVLRGKKAIEKGFRIHYHSYKWYGPHSEPTNLLNYRSIYSFTQVLHSYTCDIRYSAPVCVKIWAPHGSIRFIYRCKVENLEYSSKLSSTMTIMHPKQRAKTNEGYMSVSWIPLFLSLHSVKENGEISFSHRLSDLISCNIKKLVFDDQPFVVDGEERLYAVNLQINQNVISGIIMAVLPDSFLEVQFDSCFSSGLMTYLEERRKKKLEKLKNRLDQLSLGELDSLSLHFPRQNQQD